MLPTPEEQLLKMCLTGKLPPDHQRSFDLEKEKGNNAYRESRYDDAVHHYNEAETINPMSPIPPANRAMVYIKSAQFEKAKQEAAVAHELHQALPSEERSNNLRVKILLRRATASKHLMLFALAAEDYQTVLDLEDNVVAKRELALLKHKYHINPLPRRRENTGQNVNSARKIQVVQETLQSPSSDGVAATASSRKPTLRAPTSPGRGRLASLQDETALVQLPKSVLQKLASTCSGAPPRSPAEFERAWRSLHDNSLAQAMYLLETVGYHRVKNGILGDSLTPQLLERFVNVLTAALEHDSALSCKISQLLEAITKVSRFQMLLMFFSSEEKKAVMRLLEALQINNVSEQQIRALKDLYA